MILAISLVSDLASSPCLFCARNIDGPEFRLVLTCLFVSFARTITLKPQKRAVMGFAYAQNLSCGDSLLPEDDPKLRRFFFPWSLNRAQGWAGQRQKTRATMFTCKRCLHIDCCHVVMHIIVGRSHPWIQRYFYGHI